MTTKTTFDLSKSLDFGDGVPPLDLSRAKGLQTGTPPTLQPKTGGPLLGTLLAVILILLAQVSVGVAASVASTVGLVALFALGSLAICGVLLALAAR